MKIFQYWDATDPPQQIAARLSVTRRINPDLDYQLFDKTAAENFLSSARLTSELKAFKACAVPAMQADYIRLCLLETFGGVYVDADETCYAPVSTLIETAPRSLILTTPNGGLSSGFLAFRQAGDPFVCACRALAQDNIETRCFSTAFTATGPGVLTIVRGLVEPHYMTMMMRSFDNMIHRAWGVFELIDRPRSIVPLTPQLVDAVKTATFISEADAEPWIRSEAADYKISDRHWVNWSGPAFH